MQVIPYTTNPFGGVLPDPTALNGDPDEFRIGLKQALNEWRGEGFKVAWLEVPIDKSRLIAEAVEAGFIFHHSGDDYLMLPLQIEAGAYVPAHASHYIGAGGVTINEREELLVVRERYHPNANVPPRFKLPGGALHEGEHLATDVVREVLEETGVKTRFDALICMRHWHGYRFGKSDIYFVCRLHPLSDEIRIQESEIAECVWMATAEYLRDRNVSAFNKQIVQAAMDSPGSIPSVVEGYGEAERYEFFMPVNGRRSAD